MICAEPVTTVPIAVLIVSAVTELPKAVDCPAIVIELFVSDELPILESVFDAPLIVLLVSVTVDAAKPPVYTFNDAVLSSSLVKRVF